MLFDPNPVHGVAEAGERPVMLPIRLPVLGVPVVFETDAPIVRDAVETALGSWRLLEGRPGLISQTPSTPRIRLHLGADAGARAARIAVFSPGPGRVELAGRGVRGWADAASLTACCTVPPAVLQDRYVFEETVLPSLVLGLTSYLDRQPLHAAAIRRDGRALLLHGRSGAGKSTLAYAASCSGWDVLTDDAAFIQSRPSMRVWTRAPRLHLPVAAARWFPELAARPLVRRPNGKLKFCVEPLVVPDRLRPSEHAVLCLLEHDSGEPDARRVDGAVAVQTVLRSLDAGFDLFRDTIGPVLRTLAGDTAWIVRTSPDPRRTIALLDELH